MNVLFQNPELSLLIIIIVFFIGKEIVVFAKELFLKKDDKIKIEQDINNQSIKIDGGLSKLTQDFTGAVHNLELKTADRFTCHSENFLEKLMNMYKEIDAKYVSKETNKKQEERLEMVEKAVSEIRNDVSEMKPYLEKINMIYTRLQNHINKDE